MVDVVSLPTRAPEPKSGFCETPTAIDILNALRCCHAHREIGVIAGEPGVGKTAAIRAYGSQDPYVYVVTVSPATSALVPCLAAVAQVLGACNPNTGAGALRDVILGQLVAFRHGRNAILVFDEAQHLSDPSIEEIRSLHDETEMGVVLAGHRSLASRWTDKSAVRRSTWAQLASRIGVMLDLAAPSQGDVDALCDHLGIAGQRPRRLLHKAASEPGGLRVVVKLAQIARELAKGERIELSHIEAAMEVRGTRR